MKINKTVKNKKVFSQSTANKPVNKPLPKTDKKVSRQVVIAEMNSVRLPAVGKREDFVVTKHKAGKVFFDLNTTKPVEINGPAGKSKQYKATQANGQKDQSVSEKAAPKRKLETVQGHGSSKRVRLAPDADYVILGPLSGNNYDPSKKPKSMDLALKTDSGTESDSKKEQPWRMDIVELNGDVVKVHVFNVELSKTTEKARGKTPVKVFQKESAAPKERDSEQVLEKSRGKTPVKVFRNESAAPKQRDSEQVLEKSRGKTPVKVFRNEPAAPKERDSEQVLEKSREKTLVKVFRNEPAAPKQRDSEQVLEKSRGKTPVKVFQKEPDADELSNHPEINLKSLNVFENSIKTNAVLTVLKQDIELYGTAIVTLLYGRITINGYKVPKNVPLTVYSPKGFNWAIITAMPSKKLPDSLSIYEQVEQTFSRAQVEKIVSMYTTNDAILMLQRNSGAKNMICTFDKHMSEKVFPLINVTNRPYHSSEYLINCKVQQADASKVMQVPIQWKTLPVKEDNRFVITGGKSVGKSTLLRYMVNRHLEVYPRALLIDLDIGQPEIFVPQTVSCTVIDTPLLGPGIFLNKQPNIAFVVGNVDVVMCAEPYARAVRKLLACCWESLSLRSIPWLVNTMGYNKGFGKELMSLIVDCVEPTDVAQIFSTKSINNFDEPLDRTTLSKVKPMIYVAEEFKLQGSLPNYKLHHLMCAVPQDNNRSYKRWTMSALDVRYSNLLARLSAALHGNAKYLTECKPVQVNLDALQIVHLTSNENSRDELIAGMEANVVYLCKRSYPDQPVECLGIGVVRSIDYKHSKVYLVPAMPYDRLTKVTCLVIGGGSSLPQGFFKDQGANVANKVSFVFVIEDSKSSKSVNQIYHRPPGFLGNPAKK